MDDERKEECEGASIWYVMVRNLSTGYDTCTVKVSEEQCNRFNIVANGVKIVYLIVIDEWYNSNLDSVKKCKR